MVAEPLHKKAPDFRPGDTVKVHIKVVEGDNERIQAFEGTCLSRRGSGDSVSFTVRKISFGVGVERTFPLNSPHIDKIEVIKSGHVRRARLYYLRDLTGKAARVNELDGQSDGSSSKPGAAASSSAEAASDGKSSAAAKKPAARKGTDSSHAKNVGALGAASSK